MAEDSFFSEETETEKPEEVKAPEIATNVELMAQCIKDARQAYTLAGETPATEDVRCVAISLYIDAGKDKRTTQIGASKGYSAPRTTPVQSSNAPANSGAMGYFKMEYDSTVVLKIIEDTGEFTFRDTVSHGFIVENEGQRYKFATSSKVLLGVFTVGKVLTITKIKDGKYTKYEVK